MDKPFRLGLTMAGAVSAGAYTGGVLDYLIQALDAWYEKRSANDPGVPSHSISIDVISGASAGGITGAIAVLALFLQNRNPVTPDKRNDEEYLSKNVFYDTWVNLLQDDMLPLLLATKDIDKEHKVISLINSGFIEDIAAKTIINVPECTEAPPGYISKKMELILTLTNLDGFTYALNFASDGSSRHVMTQHRDYAFFRLGNEYGNDGRIPLNLQRPDTGLKELVQAAPATGAFPVGLAYRKFVRKKKYILDNTDLVYYKKGISHLIEISEDDPEEEYVTYNVDGGMLNNEPFDLTMKLMVQNSSETDRNDKDLKKEEHEFDSTIIMIDPFPSNDSVSAALPRPTQKSHTTKNEIEKAFKKFPYNLLQVINRIYQTMRSELLFKGEDIVRAFSSEDFSRFMIAPRRIEKNPDGTNKFYNGSIAIACGALGGFSGFFDKNFRQHDFYLGRTNCQSFLRNYFRISLKNGMPVNPLFAKGYSREAIERFKFQDKDERNELIKKNQNPDNAPWYVPIIPDMMKDDASFNEIPITFPVYNMDEIDKYRKDILKRSKIIAKSFKHTWWFSTLVNLVFFFYGNKMYKKIRNAIETEFTSRGLLK